MSERKVLNKYYPPDFDPSKIPRMKLAKNRQYTVRLMAPFNMRCATCGEYIYKGKKFNARKEDVEGEDYLGIRIFRFYIKCTRCLQEISFRTDPKNTDYEIEAGATRNFMALKLAEEQAQREQDERVADEATNPMKLLENRTKQSKQELELLESLEELKDLNKRQRAIDYDSILSQYNVKSEAEQELEDEEFIKSIFKDKPVKSQNNTVVEEIIEVISEDKNPLKRRLNNLETDGNAKSLKKDESISSKSSNSESNLTSSPLASSSSSSPSPSIKTATLSSKVSKPSKERSVGGLSLLKKNNLVKLKPKNT